MSADPPIDRDLARLRRLVARLESATPDPRAQACTVPGCVHLRERGPAADQRHPLAA